MKTLLYIDNLVPPGEFHPHDDMERERRFNAFGRMKPENFRNQSAHRMDVFGTSEFFADRVHRVRVEDFSASELRDLLCSDAWFQTIIGGSDRSVYSSEPWAQNLLEALASVQHETRAPIFGICFGFQAMVKAWGGEVVPMEFYRKGPITINSRENMAHTVKVSHGDHALKLPEESQVEGQCEEGLFYDVSLGRDRGVQFHPES